MPLTVVRKTVCIGLIVKRQLSPPFERSARPDLQQISEQVPGPFKASSACCRPDRFIIVQPWRLHC